MSYYSEWKVGAISDDEYSHACWVEDQKDKAAFDQDDYSVENCEYYKDGKCTWLNEPCNGGLGCE